MKRVNGGFAQAPGPPSEIKFGQATVRRLVERGLMRWVNRAETAAVLTEEGKREK